MKNISTRTFRRNAGFGANLFEQVLARTNRPLAVVPDEYPGVPVPVAVTVVGQNFRATYRTEKQARRAAFLGMASK